MIIHQYIRSSTIRGIGREAIHWIAIPGTRIRIPYPPQITKRLLLLTIKLNKQMIDNRHPLEEELNLLLFEVKTFKINTLEDLETFRINYIKDDSRVYNFCKVYATCTDLELKRRNDIELEILVEMAEDIYKDGVDRLCNPFS